MNLVQLLVFVLAAVCIALAAAQMSALRLRGLAVLAIVLGAGILMAGDVASRTSLAQVASWVSDPQRRLDLSALLLLEALVFGGQAVAAAQGRAGLKWRIVGACPPPTLLAILFFGQVAAMLTTEGLDYALVSWACVVVFAGLFVAAACLLRVLLPDPLMRSGLRVALYIVQAAIGLWLARPAQALPADPTPAMWARLGVLAIIVFVFMALGWLWLRRSTWNR
ncbi:hypothetical protein ACFO0J_04305 [Castellaniella hirudinis]|uniref:Uncharacterized protein n=1 Tax=Castellaniella hirudinis TaxID=1144617 RepID=A0ABV8RV74_9BURK